MKPFAPLALIFSVLGYVASAGQQAPAKPLTHMLTDQELTGAIREKANLILARILSSTLLIPGTRSQRTEYRLEVRQTLLGQGSGVLQVTHFGKALLETGKTYLIVAVPTPRFPNTQEVRAWAEVPEDQQSAILKRVAERLLSLAPPKE